MKKKLYTICLMLLTAALLSGCSKKQEFTSDELFDAYLKLKRIATTDEEHVKVVREKYDEREIMANVIEKQELLDKALLAAELNEFRKEMMISRYFEKYLNENVTEAAIKNYYSNHQDDYELKKVHVAHILIRAGRNIAETERQAKLTTAQAAYSQIKKGKDFGEVAREYSEDKISGKKGGDLGWIKEGAVDQKFSETAFQLKVGEVSELIETRFGYHIIKLLEGPIASLKPLDAVKGDIRYKLRGKAKQKEMERLKKEFFDTEGH